MGMEWFLLLCLFHFPILSNSLCLPDQSSALLQFKNSFTVDTTYYCDGATPKTATWKNGIDCCSWLGVKCHPISGHVIGLDLSCSGLQGQIHSNSTLFYLSHLQSLDLAFNDFSLSPFSPHFGKFTSLTHLNLSYNGFEGEIPSTISHLSKLISLDLSGNGDGVLKWKESTWKRFLQNATGLKELVLDHTDMSSIPYLHFSNLSFSLVTLGLSRCQLKGSISPSILELTLLTFLDLSGNNLQGSIPFSFSNLTLLIFLDLSRNNLQGSISPSFSNLTLLTSLYLSENHLNGSIPSSLLALPCLSFLYLSSNQLSGQIPNVFHQPNTFQVIDLSENIIQGKFPSSLSNLQHLVHLDLSSNHFNGQIPEIFGALTELETLYLYNNSLEGQIPSSLFSSTHLYILDCSSNKLEGPLPNKIQDLSNLTLLYLNDNLLNGTIPSWCFSFPSLTVLYLSNNHFTGHISEVSSHSLEELYFDNNKLQGTVPESIFTLLNLTDLDLSSNNFTGPLHFPLFSKLPNLTSLSLSHNNQLLINFNSSANYTFSQLSYLYLSSLSLTEFPNLFGKFPSLVRLDLANNKLNGRAPTWLYEMSSLQYLNLSQTMLTSSLDQFSWNPQLFAVDLSFNSLAGGISSSICNATLLWLLNLSYNELTGTIPQCLTNISSLSVLDVKMNKLHGTLPNTFSENNMLTILNLNGNQLEGLLPKSLSNCTNLEVLNLGNNQMKDIFPHWLQTLPYLKVLVLQGNQLHGQIASPKAQHPFPSLIILDISSNNFNGPIPQAYIKSFTAMKNVIPDEFQYMETDLLNIRYIGSVVVTIKDTIMTLTKIPTKFVYIDLSKNKFEGEIPPVIGELHALVGLNLSHNRLNGSIPQSMGNLTNLESLDLSSNMLTGRIPTQLVDLNFLGVLDLSENRLVGEIPHGKQFDTFSNDSYKGNLGLCGLPLSKKCGNNNQEQHFPPLSTLQHEEMFGFGWEPVAIGYGCGFVFGVGIGCCVGKSHWLVKIVGGQPKRRVKRRKN